MKIEQIYTGCLAQGAYYIESEGEAIVIDPLREIENYVEKAEQNNATIKYIFETHFHADFVSGHLDLAKKTGAKIVYGPTAAPAFEAIIAKDGEEFSIGKVTLQVLHTPGHTMESSCFLLKNENGKPVAIFTGDTLFIGDVGRPDLAQKVKPELTQEVLAAYLYDSLHNKILPLPDDIIVYPAHGAGSACGKNMSNETTDTLGHQKTTNYALQPTLTKEEFIKEILTGLTPPPQYFPLNVLMNIKGYESIDEVIKRGTQALSPDAFEAAANETGALIIDTRDAQEFAKAFIPNAVNIGLDGQFANWVGTLIPDIKQPILFVTEPGREEEVVTRMARVGYDYSIGYLKGGFASWKNAGKEVDQVISISADELAKKVKDTPGTAILDVRRKSEYDTEHIVNAENVPLDYINQNMQMINREQTYYVHCAGGYRSMIFISVLKARGFNNLVDVKGGFKAIKETGKFNITEYVRPTTML
ncbi:MAG TPA: MBL fold metallo-hydrolase [Chitinophagaceae bacterium]|jgi:glyoxylase-like metal-dependent hydrolase (beta-lactamase superfamily II)/rhodanese-related sulfurtransferase|nr:MBL fold metallo-hydrolase [Chitinophagaceae bacterium]